MGALQAWWIHPWFPCIEVRLSMFFLPLALIRVRFQVSGFIYNLNGRNRSFFSTVQRFILLLTYGYGSGTSVGLQLEWIRPSEAQTEMWDLSFFAPISSGGLSDGKWHPLRCCSFSVRGEQVRPGWQAREENWPKASATSRPASEFSSIHDINHRDDESLSSSPRRLEQLLLHACV